MLGVAGGGGGNSEPDAYSSYIGRPASSLDGGGAGSGGGSQFGAGNNARNYDNFVWRETTGAYDDVPNCTEGPDGGGAGWQGGWANSSEPIFMFNSPIKATCTKSSGQGGSNYATSSTNYFSTPTGKRVRVTSKSSGVGSNVGTGGICIIEWIGP